MEPKADGAVKKYWEIWLTAFYLGLTSFGGPVAHLGYFHAEYVVKKRWLDDSTFADLVALCQFLPGPASSQVGIAIGTYRGGVVGGILAWLGFTLPSSALLVLAFWGLQQSDSLSGVWIYGLKLVAVPVVAHAVWGMGTKLAPDKTRAGIAILAAAVVLLHGSALSQILVIILAGGAGFWLAPRKNESVSELRQEPVGKATGWFCLTAFFVLLAGLPLLRLLFPGLPLAVFDSFYRSGSLVFGGGHVVLPLLEQEVVRSGWVESGQFLAGYGLAQAVPGPLFTLAAYLGAVMGGVPFAVLATVAVFLPSFLLVLGVLPFWNQVRKQSGFQAALWGINAAVVGLLLAALYQPVWTAAVKKPQDFVIALLCFGLLQFWKKPAWIVVLLSCFLSVLAVSLGK